MTHPSQRGMRNVVALLLADLTHCDTWRVARADGVAVIFAPFDDVAEGLQAMLRETLLSGCGPTLEDMRARLGGDDGS